MHATRTPLFAGPYDVEIDITLGEIEARRRPDSPEVRARLATNVSDLPRLAENATELLARTPTLTLVELAQRLGVQPGTVEKRVQPHIQRPVPFHERRYLAALDRLIAAGRPFTAEALPEFGNPRRATEILEAAAKAGRLRKAGRRNVSYSTVLWQPVAADEHLKTTA